MFESFDFAAAPFARVWQGQKQRPTHFATSKNAPGIDYAKRKETQFETLSKGLDDVEEYLSNEPKTS